MNNTYTVKRCMRNKRQYAVMLGARCIITYYTAITAYRTAKTLNCNHMEIKEG